MTTADPIRRLLSVLLAPILVLAPAACSPQAAESTAQRASAPAAASVHPQSGLEVIPLTVTAGGRSHAFRVEVARSPQDQARGLMFRTALGPDEGMLFPYDPPRIASFWMRNTVIPLDLIFIGPDHRVINVAANAVPYSEESIRSDAPAIAVLELNGGRAAELGIGPGAEVRW
ncbi:MAG: DUF192 domain-containing protein [Porphyrobacter sp.]|nr:DUF192 domain-containing protein [Porphyrobacter sp.]